MLNCTAATYQQSENILYSCHSVLFAASLQQLPLKHHQIHQFVLRSSLQCYFKFYVIAVQHVVCMCERVSVFRNWMWSWREVLNLGLLMHVYFFWWDYISTWQTNNTKSNHLLQINICYYNKKSYVKLKLPKKWRRSSHKMGPNYVSSRACEC